MTQLDAIERQIRGKVPDTWVRAGYMPLLEIVGHAEKTSGLEYAYPRPTIQRLCQGLGIKPYRDTRGGHSQAKAVSLDEAVAILIGCHLIKKFDMKPAAAAAEVKRHLEQQGRIFGARLLDRQVELAIGRFDRHVRARLVGTLLSMILDERELAPGTIAYIERAAGGLPAKRPPSWTEEQLRLRLHQPRADGLLAIVGENNEVLFTKSLAATVLDGRACDSVAVPRDTREFLVLVARPGHELRKEPPRALRDLDTQSDMIAQRLLQTIMSAFENLGKIASQSLRNPVAIKRDPSQSSLLLWLLALLASEIAKPSTPAQVAEDQVRDSRCIILEPQSDDSPEVTLLETIATSEAPPWTHAEPARSAMRMGQSLSGYASATNMTLAIASTEPPYDQLVSQHRLEAQGPDGRLQCLAIPIPCRRRTLSPVMYVSTPPGEALDVPLLKVLQTLAPVVGELIERTRDMRYTVEASAAATASKILTTSELKKRIVAELKRMSAQDASAKRTRNRHARAAFVLIRSRSSSGLSGEAFGKWLSGQLPYLVPRVFLNSWIRVSRLAIDPARIVFGHLAGDACLVLIPAILQREDLYELRATIPSRVNARGGFGENNVEHFRLDAWVIDERWNVIEEAANADGTQLEKLVDLVTERAVSACKVMHEMIEAHRRHEVGEWKDALKHARMGLAIDPQNSYLNWRAAEFSVFEGNFVLAEQFARKVDRKHEHEWLLAQCVLGDALLGQGKLKGALDAYRAAADFDKEHPLAPYSRGFALLTVARLLWQAADEIAREALDSSLDNAQLTGLRTRIEKADTMRAKMCEAAELNLSEAERLSKPYPVPVIRDARTFYGPPIAYALYQVARASRNIPPTVQLLDEARRAFPRDDLLHREQVMARMWSVQGLARGLLDDAVNGRLEFPLI